MNTKKSIVTRIGEIAFYLGVLLEVTLLIIDKSDYVNPAEGILFRISFGLFLLKLLTTKYNKKEWLTIMAFGLLAVISYFINTRDEVVRLAVLIASCKDVDLKKLLKVTFFTTLAGCLLLMVLSITGIYGNISFTADFGREKIETRYIFGLGHPNSLHGMLIMLSLLFFYIYDYVVKWYVYVILMILNIVLYYFTVSNTGMMVTTMIIVLAAMLHYVPTISTKKWPYILVMLAILGGIALSMWGAAYGKNAPVLHEIDEFINGRFKSAFLIEDARIWNWKLFSQPGNEEYFDATYIKLCYWYGIIPALVYIGGNFYLLKMAYQKNDRMLLLMIGILSVYNIMEAHVVSIYLFRNYLFLIMGYYWYQPFVDDKEKEVYFIGLPKLFFGK